MLSLRPFSADPFREIDRLESDMNRMIRGLSSSLPQGGMSSELMTWNPVMDIKTNDREMTISMELPGVRKEDVNIEIDKGLLTISGKKEEEKKEEKGQYLRSERFFGSFVKTLKVPENITEKDIKAKFENGVLCVCLPNVQQQKKEAKRITIS